MLHRVFIIFKQPWYHCKFVRVKKCVLLKKMNNGRAVKIIYGIITFVKKQLQY